MSHFWENLMKNPYNHFSMNFSKMLSKICEKDYWRSCRDLKLANFRIFLTWGLNISDPFHFSNFWKGFGVCTHWVLFVCKVWKKSNSTYQYLSNNKKIIKIDPLEVPHPDTPEKWKRWAISRNLIFFFTFWEICLPFFSA